MPPQEQAELWMALRDRMTVDWKELTTQEKKACKCTSGGIAFRRIGVVSVIKHGGKAIGKHQASTTSNTTSTQSSHIQDIS
jgi:hypothetical protein